jgi:uncharacterized protein (DUF952 family)
MQYQSIEESREAGVAYHLAPTEVWGAQKDGGEYLPEAFDRDGFIHATNGLERLIWVANEFYTGDERPHTVLVLDVEKLTSELRYDDAEEAFPHIYGPLNTSAVIGELSVERGPDGAYSSFGTFNTTGL